MNHSSYTHNPTSLQAPRFLSDKYPTPSTISHRQKARESQPPNIYLSSPKPTDSSFHFDKHHPYPLNNPYTPSNITSPHNNLSHHLTPKLTPHPSNNYVQPFQLYPQTHIQPRFPSAVPEHDTPPQKPQGLSQQLVNYSNQKHQTKREDTQGKKKVNFPKGVGMGEMGDERRYEAENGGEGKRVPRFSEPVFVGNGLEKEEGRYGQVPQSSYKANNSCKHIKSPKQSDQVPSMSKTHAASFDIGKLYTPSNQSITSVSTTATSTTLKSTPKLPISLKISDFKKLKSLGSGKFGQVFMALHRPTNFLCAIKQIPKTTILSQNILPQFIRQLKIQSSLDHPNIVKLYGFFDDSKNIYLILQLGFQGQLYDALKKRKRFTEATVSYIIQQLCDAVKYLHSKNIIHRDIKPQNIVIHEVLIHVIQGTVKICDFGWSVHRDKQLRSTFCGTPLYVSPQILKGQLYDQKIDVWALGVLTYQLLVGEAPFQITNEDELVKIVNVRVMQIIEDVKFPRDVRVSRETREFVWGVMRKEPGERMSVGKLMEHGFLKRKVEIGEVEM